MQYIVKWKWEKPCTILILTSFTVQKSHYPKVNHLLATSKNVLFPDHKHPPTTGTDDPSLDGGRTIN